MIVVRFSVFSEDGLRQSSKHLMEAINTTSAEALQGYAQQFWQTLKTRMFYDFVSLEHFTVIDGVKGQVVLTDLEIGNLVKRASTSFMPSANIIKYRPRTLFTKAVDVDFEINPKLLANSYLEQFRAKGQNNKDIPFEAQVMGGLANKIRQEVEFASWQAEETSTPTATDLLKKVFNGAIKILKMIRAQGHVPVPVPSGVYTIDNIIPHFDAMALTLGAEAFANGVEAHGARHILNMYIAALRKTFPYFQPTYKRDAQGRIIAVELNNGIGYLWTRPGYGASNFVFMTQRGNICYGTDDMNDGSSFKMVDTIKSIQFTTQMRIGMEVQIAEQDYIAMNDLE